MARWALTPGGAAAALVLVALWVQAAVGPDEARAVDLFPVDDIVGSVVGGASDFAGDQVAGAAVAALLGVVKFLVGDLDRDLGRQLVHFLLGLPDYTNPGYRALNAYAAYTRALAWAMLGLVFVASALRYWAAGYAGSSSYEALRAFERCAAAAAGLVALKP